jgi:DNA-binding CsgD family transcriptional regulator
LSTVLLMGIRLTDYDLFQEFIVTFEPTGFKNIDPENPLLLQLEATTETYNQFFSVADMIQSKIIWASSRSTQMIGIRPTELDAYHFIEATHPEDLEKHILGRSKAFNMAFDFYRAGKGSAVQSMNIRIRNSQGEYPDLLFQLYYFYSTKPHNTVYTLQVYTNIDSFKIKRHDYHYYVGDDLSYFRYPDKELLMAGNPLSNHEFEIVKLIAQGLSSAEIAGKLFRSTYTINTHRRNILIKTSKNTISELIYDFEKLGLL